VESKIARKTLQCATLRPQARVVPLLLHANCTVEQLFRWATKSDDINRVGTLEALLLGHLQKFVGSGHVKTTTNQGIDVWHAQTYAMRQRAKISHTQLISMFNNNQTMPRNSITLLFTIEAQGSQSSVRD